MPSDPLKNRELKKREGWWSGWLGWVGLGWLASVGVGLRQAWSALGSELVGWLAGWLDGWQGLAGCHSLVDWLIFLCSPERLTRDAEVPTATPPHHKVGTRFRTASYFRPGHRKQPCMDFLRETIDSEVPDDDRQSQPRSDLELRSTPMRRARMYGSP